MSIVEQIPSVVMLPEQDMRLEAVWQHTERGLEDTGQLRVPEVPDSVPIDVYRQNIATSVELLAQARMRSGFSNPSDQLRSRLEQQYGADAEAVIAGAGRNAQALQRVARDLFMVASGLPRDLANSTALTPSERAYRRDVGAAFELFAKQHASRARTARRGRAA